MSEKIKAIKDFKELDRILNTRIKVTDLVYGKPKLEGGMKVGGIFVRTNEGTGDECFDDDDSRVVDVDS